MPLVQVNCKPGWYPPNDAEGDLDSKMEATLALAQALTGLVAEAVNQAEIDPGNSNLASRDVPDLTPKDVLVNFGILHCRAINASDMQIVIMPGHGVTRHSVFLWRYRRAMIRDHIYHGLEKLIGDYPIEDEVGRPGRYCWPDFDIEVTLADFSGYAVDALGGITKRWGDPPKE